MKNRLFELRVFEVPVRGHHLVWEVGLFDADGVEVYTTCDYASLPTVVKIARNAAARLGGRVTRQIDGGRRSKMTRGRAN